MSETAQPSNTLSVDVPSDSLEIHAWQVQAIERAIEEADNGKAKFVEQDQVVAWLKTRGRDLSDRL